MRIEQISVTNYRGAQSCNVVLGRADNIAVFAGANGSGKTSLIEACRYCLGQMYGLRSLPAYPHDVSVQILGNDGIRYVIRRNLVLHSITTVNGNVVPMTKETASAIGLSANWYFTSWRDPRLSEGVDIQANNTTVPHIPGTTKEETLEYIKNTLVRWDVTAQFNRDQQQISQVRDVFNRLSAARNMFFPNESGAFVSRSVGSVLMANGFAADARNQNFKFDLYFQRSSDMKLISVNDLSSGEIEVLCFLGVLLLNPALSTVYIDEPELHLNQQWHAMLLRALQVVAPNVQFIVGTHSPEIWNSVYPAQRFLLVDGRCVNA